MKQKDYHDPLQYNFSLVCCLELGTVDVSCLNYQYIALSIPWVGCAPKFKGSHDTLTEIYKFQCFGKLRSLEMIPLDRSCDLLMYL